MINCRVWGTLTASGVVGMLAPSATATTPEAGFVKQSQSVIHAFLFVSCSCFFYGIVIFFIVVVISVFLLIGVIICYYLFVVIVVNDSPSSHLS